MKELIKRLHEIEAERKQIELELIKEHAKFKVGNIVRCYDGNCENYQLFRVDRLVFEGLAAAGGFNCSFYGPFVNDSDEIQQPSVFEHSYHTPINRANCTLVKVGDTIADVDFEAYKALVLKHKHAQVEAARQRYKNR